jgi:hypothetical protein
MHRQGFDLQLTQYDERGWRATFYTTGMERCPLASGARAAVGLACFPVQAPHQRAMAISSASQAFTRPRQETQSLLSGIRRGSQCCCTKT